MNADPVKLLPVALSKVRAQDAVVVVTFVLAVVVFRAPDVWELKPSWQLDVPSAVEPKSQKNLLPLPVIADLDSDGTNELIITTNDSRLKILTLPPQGDSDHLSTLPHLHMKAEVVLQTNSSKPTLPVALGVGCVKRSVSSLDICRQIVVAVTADGVVHCFSDRLELLWMTRIFTDGKSADSYYKEIAVRVVPYIADHGLVLVGGTITEGKQVQDHLEHDHQHNFSTGLSAEDIAKLPPRRHRNTKTTAEEQEHFSTYALNSKTGSVHWKHEPEDYGATKISKEDLLSAYHFKLALHSSQYHVGEVHWSQYTDSLITSLPYRWQHPGDTTLHTAVFAKKTPNSSSQNQPGGVETGAQTTANKTKPNAVVVHREKCIEVFNLDSGQPLCTYSISKDFTGVGDVNGDGVIDHVTTYFTSERLVQSEINPCSGVVTSGSKTLFSGSICRPTSSFGGYFDSVSEEDYYNEPSPVVPLLVRSPPGRKGIFSHLSGVTSKREGIPTFDSLFVIGTGRLTSFGPYGEFNWQVDTAASWKTLSQEQQQKNKPQKGNSRMQFVPNIQATSTSVGETEDAVLVAGWKGLALVSLTDGALLAFHSLPCQPMSPVVHGDFTNDGLMDFVVHCRKSYLGFSLDSRPGYWWTAVWIACGLGVIGLAVVILRFIEEVII